MSLYRRYALGSKQTTEFCFIRLTFKQLDNSGTNYVALRKMNDIMCEIETEYDRVSAYEHLPVLCFRFNKDHRFMVALIKPLQEKSTPLFCGIYKLNEYDQVSPCEHFPALCFRFNKDHSFLFLNLLLNN